MVALSLLFHRLLLLVAVVGRALQRFNANKKLHNNIKSNKDSNSSRVLFNNNNVNNIMLYSVNLSMNMDDWYVLLQQGIEEAVIHTQEEIHEVMMVQGEEEG